MNKPKLKYYLILVALLAILVIVEYTSPEAVNWTINLEKESDIPYGTKILFEQLNRLFMETEVNDNSFFEFFRYRYPSMKRSSYIIITYNISPEKYDLEKMLKYAADGNDLFVAAPVFGQNVMDTLGFYSGEDWVFFSPDTAHLKLVSISMNRNEYLVKKQIFATSISEFDTATTKVLGINTKNEANFIRISYGAGFIYLSTQPLMFTNYHILYSTGRYATHTLSYLDSRMIVWDEYYKPFRNENPSPFRVLLADKSFRSAYYLLMISVLIFILFESKRKQRAIPVIAPPENKSLEFTRLIGQLYLQKNNHTDIAQKQIGVFLEYLRVHYRVSNFTDNDEYAAELAEMTGANEQTAKALLKEIRFIRKVKSVSEGMLIALNRTMDEFMESMK
ncbi:MAG: DUF4350 domain-containing protein [Bacteroidota bacterium]